MKNNDLDTLLNGDSLATAETITGKSYKEDERTSLLGLFINMQAADLKKKVLSERGDSTFSMKMKDYCDFLVKNEFEKVHG